MNDFDKRFKKRQDEFDRDFDRSKKLIIFVFILNVLIILTVASFVVWVIIKLLQFFGVI